jgi:hypothetical protein
VTRPTRDQLAVKWLPSTLDQLILSRYSTRSLPPSVLKWGGYIARFTPKRRLIPLAPTTTEPMKDALTIETLIAEAALFSLAESTHDEPALFGVTDGKAVGTYLEHKFIAYLMDRYSFAGGNSALGIDIPSVNVDIKVTSIRQPQSSSPFKSARQKIYGLGYGLVIFVYEKTDDAARKTGRLAIQHTIYIAKERTADYQMTRGLREILARDGNEDDLIAFIHDKNLPVDDIEAANIAKQLLQETPEQGYLTISNALQWRLQYSRVIQQAGSIPGIQRIV